MPDTTIDQDPSVKWTLACEAMWAHMVLNVLRRSPEGVGAIPGSMAIAVLAAAVRHPEWAAGWYRHWSSRPMTASLMDEAAEKLIANLPLQGEEEDVYGH